MSLSLQICKQGEESEQFFLLNPSSLWPITIFLCSSWPTTTLLRTSWPTTILLYNHISAHDLLFIQCKYESTLSLGHHPWRPESQKACHIHHMLCSYYRLQISPKELINKPSNEHENVNIFPWINFKRISSPQIRSKNTYKVDLHYFSHS